MKKINDDFFDDVIYFEEKRYELNEQKKKDLTNQIKNFLQNCTQISFAFMHGSFLDNMPFRDIDIAVFYNNTIAPRDRVDFSLDIGAELTYMLHLPVDVHALNQAKPGFCYEVTKGIPLVSKNEEEMFDFIENNWRIYWDYKPVFEQNMQDIVSSN